MPYFNGFLRDFRPVYFAILKEKHLSPAQVKLEIIDEEPEGESVFEAAGSREVLEQLSGDLNFLTIYTERPVYFEEFAEKMYEENGLIITILPKGAFHAGHHRRRGSNDLDIVKAPARIKSAVSIVLDFEWKGVGYENRMYSGSYYIPIHKKPWEMAENLDITIPIGYNTVIVKGVDNTRKKPERDRFEMAFYNS